MAIRKTSSSSTALFTAALLLIWLSVAGGVRGADRVVTEGGIGSCTYPLSSNRCLQAAACDKSCKDKYGGAAHGFCYTGNRPNDYCLCRVPGC